MSVALVVVTVLLAGWFGVLGAAKVAATPKMRERAAHVGVGVDGYRGIGALELLGVGGMLVGLAATWVGVAAAAGLALLLTGAVAAHRRAGDPMVAALPAIGSGVAVAAYVALLLGTSA